MTDRLPLEWTKDKTIYEVNVRQFTKEGTFKAFESHLPRLKELGADILWFMPVQPIGKKNRKGSMGSYYSVSDYTGINEEFGTLADFKSLVVRIHEMGMFVILDWVANHSAWDNVWTVEHPEFYHKDDSGNFKTPEPAWQDVIHLNYDNNDLRKAMINAMLFWIKEADIDGFRCDMAHLVPTSFWDEARGELDKAKPVFMLAESESRDLLNKAFDAVYGWSFLHTTNAIAQRKKNVYDLNEVIIDDFVNYPKNSYQLLFTSNHDENSWEGSAIERLTFALEVVTLLSYTLPGIPLIYTGQEAGNYHRIKFFEKDQINWQPDKMFDFYKKLNALKKQNSALWNGSYGGEYLRIYTAKSESIFAFTRRNNDNQVVVITNLSAFPNTVQINGNLFEGEYRNVFTDEKVLFSKNAEFKLNAWQYLLFERL